MIPDFDYRPPDVPLDILYQDDQIIVANKPAGLLSVPGKLEGREDCLVSRLQAAHWDALLVHRLDCDTSGVIIFARTKQAQGFLGQEFEHRRAKKTYVARVMGEMAEDSGHVDLPLGADWPNRPRQMVSHEHGRPALTDWQVIGRAPGETRVRLSPLTGRSHQLRVHMLALGHPILGDPIYATDAARDFPRLMLHAETLGLHHPRSGAWVEFTAPCPF
jgi:tRNA pseudouridine32 synthase/23S rRNA pseudouridine746 synthase